jgi:predicted DNA-binding transcriptional regulator YafY
MAESYLRLLEILRMLPRFPNTISTTEIGNRVLNKGYEVTVKTIQRDLQAISRIFPVTSVEDTKPYRWGWMEKANIMDIPSMDQKTALTFFMIDEYLSAMIPRSVFQFLEPYFNRAKAILEDIQKSTLSKWIQKIAVIPKGQPLLKAEFKESVRNVVYDGLLNNKQISITYKRLGAKRSKTYPVHPLGLVFRNEIIYLVAIAKTYKDPAQFPLHRILKAELTETDAIIPKGTNLKTFIGRGEFSYPYAETVDEEEIVLEAAFHKYHASRLEETPLSSDQVMMSQADGRVTLKATVLNSLELREWLRGFGDSVEVIAPASLRAEFIEMIENLLQMYEQ